MSDISAAVTIGSADVPGTVTGSQNVPVAVVVGSSARVNATVRASAGKAVGASVVGSGRTVVATVSAGVAAPGGGDSWNGSW